MHTRYTAHTAGVLHVYKAQLPTCGGACGSCTGSLVAVYVASAPVAAAQAQHGTRQHVAAHTAHSTAAGGTWQHTAHSTRSTGHKHTAGTRHQVPQATRWRSLPVLMRRTGYRSNATGAWPQSPAGLLGLGHYVGAYSIGGSMLVPTLRGWLLSKGWCAVGHLQNEV